jgi:hypothetical protein
MPCWIYLRGDENAIMCEDSAEAIIRRLEEVETADAFITFAAMRYAHDDDARAGYVRALEVQSVLSMHPREYEADLDDPPDWYSEYSSE